MVISAWKDNVAPPVSGSHVAGGWHSWHLKFSDDKGHVLATLSLEQDR